MNTSHCLTSSGNGRRPEAFALAQSDRFRLSNAGVEPYPVVAGIPGFHHHPIRQRPSDAMAVQVRMTNTRFISQMPSPRSRRATQPAALP